MSNHSKKLEKYKSKTLKIHKPFLQLPYSILRSQDFLDLSPEAVKIYMKLLSMWSTVEPDKPIALSYSIMVKECKCSNNIVVRAIAELLKFGFIDIVKEHHRTNRFFIELKWFNGIYK